MVVMTLPMQQGLRILESYFKFVPAIPAKNFSCLFIVKFDENKHEPKRVSLRYFQQQFQIIGTHFIFTGMLMSFVWHYDGSSSKFNRM